jgi:hypothetical protein
MKYQEQCNDCRNGFCTQELSFFEEEVSPEGIVRSPLSPFSSRRNGVNEGKTVGQKQKSWNN